MALLPRKFNSNEHEKMGDFTAIPKEDCGKNYPAQIVKSSMENCGQKAKDPNGKYLKLEFKILAGKYKGRSVWTQLNLVNKNPQTVEIAQKELATICSAVGKVSVSDSQELHGIPMNIKLGFVEEKDGWPAKNEIDFYSKIEEGFKPEYTPPQQNANSVAQGEQKQPESNAQGAQTAQSDKPLKPWEKKQ